MRAMRTAPSLPILLACLAVLSLACSAPRGPADPVPPQATDWQRVVGSEWRLVTLDGLPAIDGVDVTLAFDGEGRLSGSTGANRYFAGVEHDDEGGFAASAAGSTRMFRDDPPGLMQQEARYLEALGRVRGYRLVDGRLELLADGLPLLSFEPR